jgi:excisionase family DNA binding protein
MSQTPAATRLIKPSQIKSEIGIPISTLRDAVHRGELPVIRIGKAWFLDRIAVDRWIESRTEVAV